MSKKRVLIPIEFNAEFPEMFKLFNKLQDNNSFEPHLLFCGANDYAQEYQMCRDKHALFSQLLDSGDIQLLSTSDLAKEPLKKTSYKFVFRLPTVMMKVIHRLFPLSSLFYFPVYFRELKKRQKLTEFILSRLCPEILVLPNLAISNISGLLAVTCRRLGIPVLVVPYSWNGRTELFTVLKNKRSYSVKTLIGWITARCFPHWAYQGVLAYLPLRIFALELLGLAPATPWIPDGSADFIAVESEAMLKTFVADGIPRQKCVLTGSFWLDHLFNSVSMRDITLCKLQKLTDIENLEKFVLCTLPPDQTGNRISGFEFSNYWMMLEFWIRTLVESTPMPIIFSLHPRIRVLREKIQGISSRVYIYEDDICDLIPHASVVIGTLSGVLRGAIASGVPVLYYDVFNYGLNEYAGPNGVIYVYSRDEFKSELNHIFSDSQYLDSLKSAQLSSAVEWGTLDGNGGGRIVHLLMKMTDVRDGVSI